MTSSLAGTVAHGARGGRGVSTSHFCRIFPGLSGTPRYSPELPGSGSHNSSLLVSRKFHQVELKLTASEYQFVAKCSDQRYSDDENVQLAGA